MSLGTCSYAQIIKRWKANIIFRNICVRTQNTLMSLGTCSNMHKSSVGRPKSCLGISAYVRRIHPCAEMIQITSRLARIYDKTPILYLMDFFALYADNPQKQAFHCPNKQKIHHRMVCDLRKNSKFGSIHTSHLCHKELCFVYTYLILMHSQMQCII